MIGIQSTKHSKSPRKLWGRLSPGHVLTSFKGRLLSDLRKSFYFSSPGSFPVPFPALRQRGLQAGDGRKRAGGNLGAA